MARFGQALKPSKPPQQLSKASEPHNPPQQLSQASHLLCHGTSLGPTSCFYWASKLLRGTFWAGLKTLKFSAAAFEGLRTSQPSAAAFGHGASIGPTSCFYWASKLLRGTFWASLKTLKTSAAAFEGLRTSQPSAAAFTGVPLALPWYLPRPHKLFLLGFETATWHVLGRPSNPQNLRTLRSSFRPWYLPRPHKLFLFGTFWAGLEPFKNSAAAFEGFRTSQPSAAAFGHGTSLGPTSCFYWASKLLRGTFWAGLKTLKFSAAAFEGLRTSQPSAAAFGHGASLGPTSCFYWASKVARFRPALKPSKPPQQLSKAWEPHNPPQQLSAMVPP